MVISLCLATLGCGITNINAICMSSQSPSQSQSLAQKITMIGFNALVDKLSFLSPVHSSLLTRSDSTIFTLVHSTVRFVGWFIAFHSALCYHSTYFLTSAIQSALPNCRSQLSDYSPPFVSCELACSTRSNVSTKEGTV